MRREGEKLKHFIHLVNKSAPKYLHELLPPNIGSTISISRYPQNYNLFNTRIEMFKQSIIPSTISIWNSLPSEKRNITSIMISKNKTPKLLLTYQGRRVENVKHAQLRMSCSKLNYHLKLLDVTDSPACLCGHRAKMQCISY